MGGEFEDMEFPLEGYLKNISNFCGPWLLTLEFSTGVTQFCKIFRARCAKFFALEFLS